MAKTLLLERELLKPDVAELRNGVKKQDIETHGYLAIHYFRFKIITKRNEIRRSNASEKGR